MGKNVECLTSHNLNRQSYQALLDDLAKRLNTTLNDVGTTENAAHWYIDNTRDSEWDEAADAFKPFDMQQPFTDASLIEVNYASPIYQEERFIRIDGPIAQIDHPAYWDDWRFFAAEMIEWPTLNYGTIYRQNYRKAIFELVKIVGGKGVYYMSEGTNDIVLNLLDRGPYDDWYRSVPSPTIEQMLEGLRTQNIPLFKYPVTEKQWNQFGVAEAGDYVLFDDFSDLIA